jgi:predicted nucleotidyltransferase
MQAVFKNSPSFDVFRSGIWYVILKTVLLKKDEITFAYPHGSFLGGFLLNDIDIALYLDPKKIPPGKESDYCELLSIELSGVIGFVADVHIMNHAPVGFQHSVFKHGQLLFSKDDELRSDLIEETSLEYIRDIGYHGY